MAKKIIIAQRHPYFMDNGGELRINGNKTLNQVRDQMTRIAKLSRQQFLNGDDDDIKKYERIQALGSHYGSYDKDLHYSNFLDSDDNVALNIFGDIRGNGNRTLSDLQRSGDFNRFINEEHPYERLSLQKSKGNSKG